MWCLLVRHDQCAASCGPARAGHLCVGLVRVQVTIFSCPGLIERQIRDASICSARTEHESMSCPEPSSFTHCVWCRK